MNPAVSATPSVAPTVTQPSQVLDSRTKRLVRQQARFRDRGGIFVPRAHNNLLDILLGRKKVSPLKRRSQSRSISVSPSKRPASKSKRGSSVGRKSGGTAPKASSSRKAKTLLDDEPEQPIAGPSRLPEPAKKPASKAATSRKRKKAATIDEETPQETKPPPKRKGRAPKSKQSTEEPTPTTTKSTTNRKLKAVAPAETLEDNPAPKKRITVSKSKAARKTIGEDAEPDDDVADKSSTAKASTSGTVSKPKAKPRARAIKPAEDMEVAADPPARVRRSRAVKSRPTYAELSDEEEVEEVPKGKRTVAVSASSAKIPPEATLVSAKRKGKQRDVVDEVAVETPSVTPKVVKGKGKGKSREQQEPVPEKSVKPKAKTGRKRAVEPDPPEDDDGEGARPAKKRKTAAPAPKEANDGPPSRTRLEAILEEDEEEAVEAVETPVPAPKKGAEKQKSQPTVNSVASKKRPRDRDEDVIEAAVTQATRKRAKVNAEPKATAPVPPAKPKKRAPVKRSKPAAAAAELTAVAHEKRVKIPSKALKENTPTSPTAAAKPTSVIKRSGPPKSVLDRVRAHAGSTVIAEDDEPDELDFLS
ncbi:hypothetical protein C8R46DRAFT_1106193 [Mycena filopes]|nr:hypothetical protein C8R46DRAFT_1106193 [Mycena filopes]